MAAPARPKTGKRRSDYEETPDWATAFQRADNQPPRPGFTGEGVLSAESLEAIEADDGKFRLSIWTLDNDGDPLRNRDGSRRFRIHVEPLYHDDDDDQGDEPQQTRSKNGNRRTAAADDDIPF